jgi:hypothetical protein
MSARANASAKNRRAGGNDIPQGGAQRNYQGQSQSQQQQQGQQQKQPPQSVKMSISDAMALVTLRLGRVEQILHNMPVDGPLGNTNGEHIRIVDDELLANILERLDNLEGSTQETSSNSTDKLTTTLDSLANEVNMTKELLMQMQLFTLKTDKKMTDLEIKINKLEEQFNSVDFNKLHESVHEE